jgi:hypothetical protein
MQSLENPLMDHWFEWIESARSFPESAGECLRESGFVVVPGPVSAERLPQLAAAYDRIMDTASGPDFKMASTTTRLYDFANRGAEFDGVYIHPPLLEACAWAIGGPFKLSSILGRTLRAHSAAQELHIDIPRDSEDLPMVGFILMVDEFRPENGATRFVPKSHTWKEVPKDLLHDLRADCDGQVLACGSAGSMIIFNGAVWHAHTANSTAQARRSIQGYFVRREACAGIDFRARMRPDTLLRISPLARYVLAV